MFQTKDVEKIKRHNLRSINIYFENGAFYETMRKNIVEQDRSQVTV